jgi:hypothetical protein
VFRADNWADVKEIVMQADHVFFACLAIRKNLADVEYPWLAKVIERKIPFSVIAAGTDLPINSNKDIYSNISVSSLKLLQNVNLSALAFTTRGQLSQNFCALQGLNNATFNGDIAFYDKKYSNLTFEKNKPIKKIIISDPHRPASYFDSMKVLIAGLKTIFPNAHIVIAQHNISKEVELFCDSNGFENMRIYEDKHSGLDIYDTADLHVGYRVHGHVSALKRRKYSYLLEQDGRGCDYGLTIKSKVSIPNYLSAYTSTSRYKRLLGKILYKYIETPAASVSPAYQMLAMIKADASDGFSRFLRLENQIEEFNSLTEATISHIVKNIN